MAPTTTVVVLHLPGTECWEHKSAQVCGWESSTCCAVM
jgi:hypothetical protein